MRKTYDVAINLFVLLVCAVHSRVDLGLSLTLDTLGTGNPGLEILLSVVIVRSDQLTSGHTTRRRQSAVSWAGADRRPETVQKGKNLGNVGSEPGPT